MPGAALLSLPYRLSVVWSSYVNLALMLGRNRTYHAWEGKLTPVGEA